MIPGTDASSFRGSYVLQNLTNNDVNAIVIAFFGYNK